MVGQPTFCGGRRWATRRRSWGRLGRRDAEYAEVLSKCRDFHAELEKERAAGKFTFAELEENEEDLAKLEAWLRKVKLRDRFGAPSAPEARAAVLACREDLEAFAASVYEAADHGSAGPAPSGP